MTLLFLLIAAAAGVVVLVYEKRQRDENLQKFQNYLVGLVSEEGLSKQEKLKSVIELFSRNNYKIEKIDGDHVTVSRREFSVGAALLWLSAAGVGLIIYLIYYFLKKPEKMVADLQNGTIHA